MPNAGATVCKHPGCGALVHDGTRRCAKHPKRGGGWGDDSKRVVKGAALTRARQELFARSPLCAQCLARGRVTLATIRDHIVPLAFGGEDEDSNIQALCAACHDVKSQAEREQGAVRESAALRQRAQGIEPR